MKDTMGHEIMEDNKIRVLCYGDSNTYGYNPESGKRYPEHVRWTGVLKNLLGDNYRVIEEGCNGRTACHDAPGEAWKNGMSSLAVCLNSQKPVDFLVVMLGTNDLKTVFASAAASVTDGVEEICIAAEHFLQDKQGYTPEILLIAPPVIGHAITNWSSGQEFDENSVTESENFGRLFGEKALRHGWRFLDAAAYVRSSEIDGLHLMPDAHRKLAEMIRDELLKDRR